MAVVFLDITAGNDPNGSILTTLDDSDVAAFEMRCGENELGSGSFTIRRDHPDATEANLATGNYVKVRIPLIQAGAVFGFWLDEHDDTLISSDEEGGETLMRGGPGTLFILRHANLLNDIHVPAQVNRGNRDVPGYWTWVGEPYGAILQRLLEEGRLEPGTPLTDVTDDFTRADDSDSLAWPDITDTFQVPIGSDGLSVYHSLVESGELFVRADPDLEVHAYKTRGVDRTSTTYAAGKVRFVKGENILTGLDKQGHGTRAATHAIVIGEGNTYRQVISPAYVPGTPGRWVTVPYDESNDATLLDKVGQAEIVKRNAEQNGLELEFLAGDDEATGLYLPFKHFRTGDLVSLDTGPDPWDFVDEPFRMSGFRIVLGEASDDSTDTLEARSLRWIAELGSGATSGALGTSGPGKGCNCLRLCHDTLDGTVILDSFDGRTETPDEWGTASSGEVWTVSSAPDAPGIEVTGGRGILATTTDAQAAVVLLTPPAYLLSGETFTMLTEFELSEFDDADPDEIRFEAWNGGAALVLYVSTTEGAIQLSDNTTGLLAFDDYLDWQTGTLYKVKWEQVYDGLGRAKIWRSADPEPGWRISAVGDVTLIDEYFHVKLIPGDTTNTVLSFDYFYFSGASTTCIYGGPNATSGDPDDACNQKAAPCGHDHAYTSAQIEHEGGTVADALAAGSGAPDDATYLVASAHAGLSAEIPVGATPGGELGGTWASPTVDPTHSGSTHDAATNTHIADATDAHDASAISIVDTGGFFTGTEVEAALQELGAGGGVSGHLADATDAHDASAISVLDTGGNFTGTDVEAVLAELVTMGGGGSVTLTPEVPAGTINGVNDTFTLSVAPDLLILFKNGLLQRAGSGNDYVLTGSTIVYEAGNIPQTGDTHLAYLNDSVTGEILDHTTAEMDDTLVLAPDGAGGVEFRAEAGGGGGTSLDLFGDGQDGSVTINSGTFSLSVGGSALITNNVLQRDAYFDDLTLNGGNLRTGGFRVFVKGTLTMTSGILEMSSLTGGGNGNNGSAGAGGSGGAGGTSTAAGNLSGLVAGITGGAGGFNAVGATPAVNATVTIGRTAQPNGAAGGISGQGQAGGQRNTPATTNTQSDRSMWQNPLNAIAFRNFANAIPVWGNWMGQGNAGGGGGGAAASGGGGGGGSGGTGGAVVVVANIITGTTNIEAKGSNGGNGGNGGGTDAGGGGGGNGGPGGWIVLVTTDRSGYSGSLVVTGGTGGTGGTAVGTGVVGGNGASGLSGFTTEWTI